ncbi:HAMP domain-containing protein [Deinococcus humi]|uniref:HAMP domain-containing protein n=1 Tax=Deinococcus humi TaxID=662880 RepID=UPI00161A0FA9|nr:hypothetical protein [Deinococcus humi]
MPPTALGLRAKLLLSYLLVIVLAATNMILIAEWSAPLCYPTHIKQMMQMFGIRDIPEMRCQLADGFTGAFGSALIMASVATLALAVSAFVSRQILRSVQRLSHTSTRIAAGHYAERLSGAGPGRPGGIDWQFQSHGPGAGGHRGAATRTDRHRSPRTAHAPDRHARPD